jgi:hypothetical protein
LQRVTEGKKDFSPGQKNGNRERWTQGDPSGKKPEKHAEFVRRPADIHRKMAR